MNLFAKFCGILCLLFTLLVYSCGGDSAIKSPDNETIDIAEPEPELEEPVEVPSSPKTEEAPCVGVSFEKQYDGPLPDNCPQDWHYIVLSCVDDLESCTTVCETTCSEFCEEESAQVVYEGDQPEDCTEGYTFIAQNCVFDEESCTKTCEASCEFQNTPKSYADGNDPNFDLELFNQKMGEGIFGRVKGYSYVLSDSSGSRVAWGYGGIASEATEPNGFYPYTHHSKQNWASNSKFISAVSLLYAIDQNPTPFDTLLESPIKNYIPYRWRQNFHPDFEPVTIRLLLQHKTGLAKDDGNLQERLATGEETAKGVGYRFYSNATGILEHMVIAYLTNPSMMDLAESIFQFLPDAEYNSAINLRAAQVYADYVAENILPAANMEASCDNSDFWEGNFAWLYATPTSGDGVAVHEAKGGDHTDKCSSGGWVTDAASMQNLLATVKYSEVIFSQQIYVLMENLAGYTVSSSQSGGEIEALGYSRFVETEDGTSFCHGGDLLNGHSTICTFPSGYQVSFVVNSGGAQGDSIYSFPLRQVLVEAYNAAHNE